MNTFSLIWFLVTVSICHMSSLYDYLSRYPSVLINLASLLYSVNYFLMLQANMGHQHISDKSVS
jgi:hypothetical protein